MMKQVLSFLLCLTFVMSSNGLSNEDVKTLGSYKDFKLKAPSGTWLACWPLTEPCPYIQLKNGDQIYALSYADNRMAFAITMYDSAGNIIKEIQKSGARYISKIDINTNDGKITFIGQADKKVVLTFDDLGIAPPTCDNAGTLVQIGSSFTTGKGGSCSTCTCEEGAKISCVGCPLMVCPAGQKLVTDPEKCCVRECVPLPPKIVKVCMTKYTTKWPHCVNIKCIKGTRNSFDEECIKDENCNGYSFTASKIDGATNEGSGCLKQKCMNDGENGFGQKSHGYRECLSMPLPPSGIELSESSTNALEVKTIGSYKDFKLKAPSGTWLACWPMTEPCPYVQLKNGDQIYALSYADNRMAFAITMYDSAGNIIKEIEKKGARYISKIEINTNDKTITLIGQADKKVVLTFDDLGIAPQTCDNAGTAVEIGASFTTGKGGSCSTCKCEEGAKISCVGCPLMVCPSGQKLVTDPEKCCVRECVPLPPKIVKVCMTKYPTKWPHCVNIKCIKGTRNNFDEECIKDENCNGYSFTASQIDGAKNEGSGCLKQKCMNDGENGFGQKSHGYRECLSMPLPPGDMMKMSSSSSWNYGIGIAFGSGLAGIGIYFLRKKIIDKQRENEFMYYERL